MEESAPVLRYLHEHATRPELTFRFRWSPGTLLVRDNRVVLHNALDDDFGAARTGMGFRRVLHRATLAGERPVQAIEGACAQPGGGVSSSSGRILTAGVSRSSNWPERTAHRKIPAIAMTAMTEIPMRSGRTSIVVSVRS